MRELLATGDDPLVAEALGRDEDITPPPDTFEAGLEWLLEGMQAAMVQLNVAAVHELTLAFLGPMVEHRAGAILNVASLAAFQPVPGMATYAATKAFVQSFSEALHAELAGTGVSCTVLAPGPVPTEFGAVAGTEGVESLVPGFVSEPPEEVAAAAVRGMLRGRRSVVPGTATKALATGGRYVPRSILLPAARRARRTGD